MSDKITHAELYRARDRVGPSSQEGQALAPAEHEAFAREWTAENPMVAAPSLAVAAPLYYIAKNPILMGMAQKAGLVGQDATPASLQQLGASYRGIIDGLIQNLTTQSPQAGKGKGS